MRFFYPLLVIAGLGIVGCAKHPALVYPYNEPLSSPGTKLSGLPPAAQRAVRSQVGTAEIADIRRFYHDGDAVYDIEFRQRDLFPNLYVRTDGSILSPYMEVAVGAAEDEFGAVSGGAVSGVRFSDLPIPVAHQILEKAPTTEVGYITKTVVGSSTFYEVTFKDARRNPKLVIAEDGEVITKVPSEPPDASAVPLTPKSRSSVTVR